MLLNQNSFHPIPPFFFQHLLPCVFQCALNSCHRDEKDNADYVKTFTGIWLQNFNLTCFYQEELPANVVAVEPSKKELLYKWLMFCGMLVIFIAYIVHRVRRSRQFTGRNASYQGNLSIVF